jgi:hypothetical protein
MDIIVGGGKHGCYAIEHLRQKGKSFTVVDTDSNCLAVKRFGLKASAQVTSDAEHFIQGDLSTALELVEVLKPEYVFPTAPVHIAANLAKIKFDIKPWPEAINTILHKLPEAVVLEAGKGKLVASFNRDNDCVEKCSMPEVCPTSQIRKPCTMTKLIRFAIPEAFLLISYSMAPGMGAIKGGELIDFFNWVKPREKFIVATTCDCHGVLNAFKKRHKIYK